MDVSPLTMIKSGEDKGDFPVSTSNEVKIPSWTSAASFQVFLTTCTIGRWKEVPTENGFEHISSWWTVSLGAKTTKFEGQGQGNVMGQEVAELYQQLDPWSQETLPTLRTLRTTITIRLNEVVSAKQNFHLKLSKSA